MFTSDDGGGGRGWGWRRKLEAPSSDLVHPLCSILECVRRSVHISFRCAGSAPYSYKYYLPLLKHNASRRELANFFPPYIFDVAQFLKDFARLSELRVTTREIAKEFTSYSLRYLRETLDVYIFRSGPVGKHFSCIINVATRNLFTNADVSTRKDGTSPLRK